LENTNKDLKAKVAELTTSNETLETANTNLINQVQTLPKKIADTAAPIIQKHDGLFSGAKKIADTAAPIIQEHEGLFSGAKKIAETATPIIQEHEGLFSGTNKIAETATSIIQEHNGLFPGAEKTATAATARIQEGINWLKESVSKETQQEEQHQKQDKIVYANDTLVQNTPNPLEPVQQ
jgi:hypothetical protein